MNELVINAENKIVGRLSSSVAKRLLLGDKIIIINAEKGIITGDPKSILRKYKGRLQIRTATAPWKGPLHQRMPDRFLRRIIRGMLPWDTPRGRTAYERLKVYMGTPKHLKDVPIESLPKIECKTIRKKVYLSEICKEIGWSPSKRE
ncbi:50S ribosomal protein L13 [Candidatus Borrarchaeum sp.]|uniref:50S ribosomal protein L13 n=1 Tax=Candidatus Borrarchaeum sp. TaxID=2846742 RepID=UPI00257EE144|nr:50S ribosomal protein L13 [Candidatus Borrarchaeum sp.]